MSDQLTDPWAAFVRWASERSSKRSTAMADADRLAALVERKKRLTAALGFVPRLHSHQCP